VSAERDLMDVLRSVAEERRAKAVRGGTCHGCMGALSVWVHGRGEVRDAERGGRGEGDGGYGLVTGQADGADGSVNGKFRGLDVWRGSGSLSGVIPSVKKSWADSRAEAVLVSST
jgi:hypothetical protein